MKNTNIQWCHSTVNPVMGCLGCELWKSVGAIAAHLVSFLQFGYPYDPGVRSAVDRIIGDRTTSELYRDREAIVSELGHKLGCNIIRQELVDIIRQNCKCYAGLLGTMRMGHKGYADKFEIPKLYPGRMAVAAKWGPPTPNENADKPWLAGCPRMIFISDMGDALSKDVPFEYLHREIIANVVSDAGQQHLWLWLTKRPERMAAFGSWLLKQGGYWPDNLVAMTTITSQYYASRVDALRRVPAIFKGLSVEPLLERVDLNIEGLDWVIVGGGSDSLAEVFEVDWALELQRQCEERNVAFFLKQLGRRPVLNGQSLPLKDRHGGDWLEWPAEWRIRQVPPVFKCWEGDPHDKNWMRGLLWQKLYLGN